LTKPPTDTFTAAQATVSRQGNTGRERSVRLRALADSGRNPPEREPFLSRLTVRYYFGSLPI